MLKIHGVSLFASLQSSSNEYAEVQAMTLTSSKAHDQYMPVLAAIPKSLTIFGHALVMIA
jgi:hypothetical protein